MSQANLPTMDPVGELLELVTQRPAMDRTELFRLKRRLAKTSRRSLIRNDELLRRYRADVLDGRRPADHAVERALTLNAVRSSSGIATVTVITEPYPCPGRCVYCPTEARAPKSYLTNEPAMMRAVRNGYDPFRQVVSRLDALEQTGHPTQKIELIVKGGTWSFYPEAYQQQFIQRCFDAANGTASASLEEAHQRNETAARRIIGATIETRPDYITADEVRRLRALGVTRVELGVQSLNERVLKLIVRDHTAREVASATRRLRDAGFKVAYHLMPNLPGALPEDDLATFRELFDHPDYRPDALKIYPCVVIESAELFQWWREGRYQPYDDETMVELLLQLKRLVPPYARIERVIRDIPSTSIRAGCAITNLREEVLRRLRARGLACRCIRCREVREATEGTFELVRRDYAASGGREMFLSLEDVQRDRLAALLRLRIPADDATASVPALEGAALVRELHTYGQHLPLGGRQESAAQHRGFGRRLMAEAERIAVDEFGRRRLAIIAGVGVREYYRKLGYELRDTYMVKALA